MKNHNIPKSIDIKIKASHFEPFINKNALRYTQNAVSKGGNSWTTPYNKPQLVAHDKNSSPIGRIFDYEIVKDQNMYPNEPANFVRLYSRISDPESIQKVIDGRYNTVSVGSKTSKVICSECDQIITQDGLCDHVKGSYNEKGELIHWIIDEISYIENSFVNEPADEFACIEAIKINDNWINYQEFLDNQETYLNELKLEDCMSEHTDAKLTAEKRSKLAESAFCGPGRSFPAHDKAHVTAGLRLLNRSNFSESTKSKIKACLYRKGKRYGIVPTKDELDANPDLLIYGVDDAWTDEQRLELETYFKDNPDSDLPETTEVTDQAQTENNSPATIDIDKLKVKELRDLVVKYQKDLEDASKNSKEQLDTKDKVIEDLNKKLEDANLITNQKEDEINKLLDEHAILTKNYKDSIIANIIDLKMADNINESEEVEKYSKRQLDSLKDALEDLRLSKKTIINSDDRVANTLQTDTANSDSNNDQNTKVIEDKFSYFYRDRSSMED